MSLRAIALKLLVTATFLSLCFPTLASGDSTVWQLAPPAPAISDAVRTAELARRRSEVRNRLSEKGLLVLFSAEPRLYTNDVDYPYRQENNLYYLTGINEAGVTLAILPSGKSFKEVLFIPRRNPQQETWTGRMLSADEARKISGIQEVYEAEQFRTFMTFISPRAGSAFGQPQQMRGPGGPQAASQTPPPASWAEDLKPLRDLASKDDAELYLLLPPTAAESNEYRQEQRFAAKMPPGVSGFSIRSAMRIFAELRGTKSEYEVRLLQHAVDISIEAFNRAYAVARPGVREYEVEAEFLYAYRKHNAFNWGYPCIVGSGPNATILHYETNQDALPDSGLLLMDCAAEYDHYSADITRTIPVNGKFTREQADIYRIVYEAQEESIKTLKAGSTLAAMNQKSIDIVKEGLFRLGLITSTSNAEYRVWFMHGAGHSLGMNVHDVGLQGKLEPGMVTTVEPGIYLRPDALDVLPKTPENEKFINAVRPAFEKYKGIGVRIEDDILITNGEPKNLSGALPRKLEEVESFVSRLRSQAARTGLP